MSTTRRVGSIELAFDLIFQCSHAIQIIHIFFFSLWAETHRYGQPPADIIKELAPGLEFDEEGMPKMDGQMPGMPFPPGVGGDECSMM